MGENSIMPPWMKRRIEHARARCEKTVTSHKQQSECKDAEKPQAKKEVKTSTSQR
jgi:hypothetical protein